MIGASKILTVSYGTFSCTLEGFDDPFNTMRAIAEYFRDLAAEDRYFGAEPPTPDAAMLHRIAEREISRRVEAKIQENGVHLRAGDEILPQTALAAPESAPEPFAQPDTVAPAMFAPAPAQTPVPAPAPGLAEAAPAADSVAQRLARLRAAQAAAAPVAVVPVAAGILPQPEPAADDFDFEDQHADASAPAVDDLVEDLVPESFPQESFSARSFAPEDFLPEDAYSEAADSDLLQSLGSLISAQDDAPEAAPEAADAAEVAAEADLAVAVAQDFDLPGFDDLPELDDLTGYLAGDIAERAAEADQTAPEAAAKPVTAATQADLPAEIAADPRLVAEVTAVVEITYDTEPETDPAPDVAEKLQRARARVIKIRRADAPAFLNGKPGAAPAAPDAAASAELIAELMPEPMPETRLSPLSPEAEDDLQRELAALEAEAGTVALADPAAEPMIETAPVSLDHDAARAEVLRQMPEASDASVSRLMAQADTELEGPENKRRLSAISHLKAAVTATLADRRINPGARDGSARRMDPYRDDLNRVVRPGHSGALVDASAGRPAPLMLVSEQRIDRPKAAPRPPVLPVRPRRVTPGALAMHSLPAVQQDEDDDLAVDVTAEDPDNIFAKGPVESFEEFADRLGAGSMPELLEAAGAYCATVLGRPHFSRPWLFQQLTGLSGSEEISLEDNLRAFGTLLRDGRITKIKRGQFMLSATSHYLSEARKIAG